jgi:hypothetical protein
MGRGSQIAGGEAGVFNELRDDVLGGRVVAADEQRSPLVAAAVGGVAWKPEVRVLKPRT